MKAKNERSPEVKRFQEILSLVRRSVGWSGEELGNRVGLTRQTINNIERGRNDLTKTQYIAIRSVLEDEVETKPAETELVVVLLDALVDNPENYSEEEKQTILDSANMMTPAIMAGTSSREEVSRFVIKSLGASVATIVVAMAANQETIRKIARGWHKIMNMDDQR